MENGSCRICRRAADDKTLTKTFDTIVYTAPGIYEYTVTQDAGGRKRADYDDTVFSLKVMVAWDTDGELKGHVSVRRDGDDGAKTELLFKNSYRRDVYKRQAYTKLGFGDVKYRYYDVDVGKAGDFVGWSTARKVFRMFCNHV